MALPLSYTTASVFTFSNNLQTVFLKVAFTLSLQSPCQHLTLSVFSIAAILLGVVTFPCGFNLHFL
jgi:hypothetical protein